MKVSKRLALGAAAAAAVGISVPTFAAPHSPAGGTATGVKCNDGTITWTPTNLWPPNHKYVPIHISYTDNDGDGDMTAITVTGVQEQDGSNPAQDASLPSVNGSGNPHLADAQPDPNYPPTAGQDGGADATYTEDVRAERSGTDGHGSGRTYFITVQCTDSGGTDPAEMTPETGTATITVTVPHDQGVVKQ